MHGTSLADSRRMHALDFEGELLSVNDRPTIPVPAPRESGVRLRVARKSVPLIAATIDLVVCDLTRDPRSCTGNFFIDDEVLASAGVKDLDQYAVTPGNKQFQPDFFVD